MLPKNEFLQKWWILTPLQKLPKNVGENNCCQSFKSGPKSNKSPDLVTLLVRERERACVNVCMLCATLLCITDEGGSRARERERERERGKCNRRCFFEGSHAISLFVLLPVSPTLCGCELQLGTYTITVKYIGRDNVPTTTTPDRLRNLRSNSSVCSSRQRRRRRHQERKKCFIFYFHWLLCSTQNKVQFVLL